MRKGVKSLDPDAPGVGKQAMLDWMHINHPKIPIKTGASREEVARKVKEVQPNRKYITSWVLFHLSHLSAWHFHIKRCFSFWGHILIVFASMPIAQTSHEPEAASVPIELPILPPPDSLFLSKLSNIKLSKKKRSPSLENKPVPNKAVLTKKTASKVRTQPLSAQAEGTSELSVREDLPKAKKKKKVPSIQHLFSSSASHWIWLWFCSIQIVHYPDLLGLDVPSAHDHPSVDQKPPITFQQSEITHKDQSLVTTTNTTISGGPSTFRRRPHLWPNDQLDPLIPEGTTMYGGILDGSETKDLITLIDFDFFESDNTSKLISSSFISLCAPSDWFRIVVIGRDISPILPDMSSSKKSGVQVFQEERKRVEQGEYCSFKYPHVISPKFCVYSSCPFRARWSYGR